MNALSSYLILILSFILFTGLLQAQQEIVATLAGATTSDGFSVKDDGGSTLLRVRGDGNVGIGTADPSATLQVEGSATISGEVNMSAMDVSFYASNGGSDYIGSIPVKVEFQTESHDDGSNYDTDLDRFIAPANGVYHFDVGVEIVYTSSSDNNIRTYLRKNNTNIVLLDRKTLNFEFKMLGGSAVIKLNAGDYIEVWVTADYSGFSILGYPGRSSYFCGHRLY